MISNKYMFFIWPNLVWIWAHIVRFIRVHALCSSCFFFVFDLFCLSFFLVFVFLASLIFFFTLVLFSIYGQTKDFGSTRLGRVKKKDIYLVWFSSRVFWPKDVFGKHTLVLFWLVLLQNNLGFFYQTKPKKIYKIFFSFFLYRAKNPKFILSIFLRKF